MKGEAIILHPYKAGRVDFATHVGSIKWVKNELHEVELSSLCGGELFVQKRGNHIRIYCLRCNFELGALLSIEEFDALWAWDLLRSLCAAPTGIEPHDMYPKMITMMIESAIKLVHYRPNWATSGHQFFILSHDCKDFNDIGPALYLNERVTQAILNSPIAEIFKIVEGARTKLYWKSDGS